MAVLTEAQFTGLLAIVMSEVKVEFEHALLLVSTGEISKVNEMTQRLTEVFFFFFFYYLLCFYCKGLLKSSSLYGCKRECVDIVEKPTERAGVHSS